MTITESTTVAEIASALPASVRVFQRHGIDFCCGGRTPLAVACEHQGLSFTDVAHDIETTAAAPAPESRDWPREPLPALIDHILATYHAPLGEELPRLESMASRVAHVHGSQGVVPGRAREGGHRALVGAVRPHAQGGAGPVSSDPCSRRG